jgi:glycosyl transferase family 2
VTPPPWLWWTLVAAATGLWLPIAVGLDWMRRRMARLTDVMVPPDAPSPSVSVVVPSRDEGREVEAATRSLLRQEGVRLEVVAVDDRSTDDTGAILDRIAAEDPRLRVVHVESLPEGWLGKNHACHVGAAAATGEWLLFTDGDVFLAPDTLRRAVAHAARHGFGHMIASPFMVTEGFWERAFVSSFAVMIALKFRMWELGRSGTGAYVGVGAFNLVRRADYLAAGGHRTLALEVVDDVKLGLILRRSGVRQGAIDSGGLVRVRWQRGPVASWQGLVKNSFAAAEWRWGIVAAGAVTMAILAGVPLAAVLAAPPPVWMLAAVPLALSVVLHAAAARRVCAGSGLEGLTFPLCGLALVAVSVWSALSATLWGVTWRGHRYPLAVLRAGCVRERDWPASRAAGWD